jgi:hypothetical protein
MSNDNDNNDNDNDNDSRDSRDSDLQTIRFESINTENSNSQQPLFVPDDDWRDNSSLSWLFNRRNTIETNFSNKSKEKHKSFKKQDCCICS